MILANHTLKQLNIIECENSHGPFSSVSRFVNKCCSNMGKRLFHYELTNPVFEETWLQNEYNSVELLMNHIEKVQNMRIFCVPMYCSMASIFLLSKLEIKIISLGLNTDNTRSRSSKVVGSNK